MDSKEMGAKIYLRLDKGEDILKGILNTCQQYQIKSATFSGLGACDLATIGTYIPEKHDFKKHTKMGMLEMVSLTGNVTWNDTNQSNLIHAHALFSSLDKATDQISYFGGDLKEARIMYTGEITIEPVTEGVITKKIDSTTGIDVWNFD